MIAVKKIARGKNIFCFVVCLIKVKDNRDGMEEYDSQVTVVARKVGHCQRNETGGDECRPHRSQYS